MPQSQWDRPVRTEWLFLGAVLVIGARIASSFLGPGWTKEVLEILLPFTITSVVINGGTVTLRRMAAIAVAAVVAATIVEVARRWGWTAAAPLAALAMVVLFRALRSGILAPRRDAPSST